MTIQPDGVVDSAMSALHQIFHHLCFRRISLIEFSGETAGLDKGIVKIFDPVVHNPIGDIFLLVDRREGMTGDRGTELAISADEFHDVGLACRFLHPVEVKITQTVTFGNSPVCPGSVAAIKVVTVVIKTFFIIPGADKSLLRTCLFGRIGNEATLITEEFGIIINQLSCNVKILR